MNFGQVRSIAVLAVCLFGSLPSQCSQEIQLDSIEKLELHHLKADIVTYRGRTAVRVANTGALDSDYSEGIAIVHGASLRDGTIEATVSGDTAPNAPPQLRGFVGIAFHVRDRSHFECFYIRPKNGRSEDQLQRNHSTQYISIPGFPWDKLRSETPGKYESYVDLVPGHWTQLKIEVKGTIAKLYVNGAEQPTLMSTISNNLCRMAVLHFGSDKESPFCGPKYHTRRPEKRSVDVAQRLARECWESGWIVGNSYLSGLWKGCPVIRPELLNTP